MSNKPARRAIAIGQTAMAQTISGELRQASVQIGRGFRLSVNGLTVQGQPSFAAAAAVGEQLRVGERAGPFALGDWYNYFTERFGEQASQVLDVEGGWSPKTCENYGWIAKSIARERRRMDRLGIRHHQLVAALSPDKQKYWLDKAANDDGDEPWTVRQLQEAIVDGEESLPETFWCLVSATSQSDMQSLQASLEAQGRNTKAVVRRGRRKAQEES